MAIASAHEHAGPPRGVHETGPMGPVPRLPWAQRLVRLGLIVRGVLYLVPGALALRWALGRSGSAMSQSGVLVAISRLPWGRALLATAAAGFAGYALWGVARAVFDPLHRGYSPAQLAWRCGYATSAVAYGGLLVATIRLLASPAQAAAPHADWTVAMLARPFGGVVVAVVGLVWILGSGLAQVVVGATGRFARDLDLERMNRAQRREAMALGRVGMIARGIAFTLIGVLLVAAALRLRTQPGVGLDDALIQLGRQPYGRWLVGMLGAGLMAFGAFSVACARWMRLQPGANAAPAAS